MGVPFVSFGGSRFLSAEGLAVASRIANWYCSQGLGLATGCAVGADLSGIRAFLAAGAADRLAVFAAGEESGAGWPAHVVPPGPVLAANAGARVHWFSGLALPPYRARLALRAQACVSSGITAVFVVAPPPSGHGSFVAAAFAASLGHPVQVVPVGWPVAQALPLLAGQAGAWCAHPARFVWGVPVFGWVPAARQASFF